MGRLFNRSPLHRNNSGNNNSQRSNRSNSRRPQCINRNTRTEAPWSLPPALALALDHTARFLMRLASCQVLQILPIPRVNIQFLAASIDMRSTQTPSRLYQEMAVCRFHHLCLIMGHRITVLPISIIMPILRLSSSLETVWDITWRDKVRITPCPRTTHPHLTWLRDP